MVKVRVTAAKPSVRFLLSSSGGSAAEVPVEAESALAEEEGRGSVEQEAAEDEEASAAAEEEEEAEAAAEEVTAESGSIVESWTKTTPIVRSSTWCSGRSGSRGRGGRRRSGLG